MASIKVAIQGIKASFHEVAAKQYFGSAVETVECLTFKQVCETLKTGSCDRAVMAIENTLAGSLLQNYALLMDYGFKIIGETFIQIQMNLLALPGTTINDLRFVHSHPIALRQCSEYLWGLKNVALIDKQDTAASAKEIAEKQLTDTAAVANEEAALTYGLAILEKRIETNKQNFTRFLVLSKHPDEKEENNKASICLQLAHHSGSLADVLHIFKEQGINLTKIQSVPIIGKPYEYSFHIDLEWKDQIDHTTALDEVKRAASSLVVLGEYEKGKFELKD